MHFQEIIYNVTEFQIGFLNSLLCILSCNRYPTNEHTTTILWLCHKLLVLKGGPHANSVVLHLYHVPFPSEFSLKMPVFHRYHLFQHNLRLCFSSPGFWKRRLSLWWPLLPMEKESVLSISVPHHSHLQALPGPCIRWRTTMFRGDGLTEDQGLSSQTVF